MQQEISNPFLGFTLNEEARTFDVHLVNPGPVMYGRIVVLTGGVSGDMDGTLETNKVTREVGPLPANGTFWLDHGDAAELDFVIWFELDLYPEGEENAPLRFAVQLPKYGMSRDAQPSLIQALDREALRIDLIPRQNPVTLEEKLKTLDMKSKYTPTTP